MQPYEPEGSKTLTEDDVTRTELPNGVILSTAYPVEFKRASELPRSASDTQVRNAIEALEASDD
jgi:hypothetical protein